MAQPYCIDCRNLRVRVSLDEAANYACSKDRLDPDGPIAWRVPCEVFAPDAA